MRNAAGEPLEAVVEAASESSTNVTFSSIDEVVAAACSVSVWSNALSRWLVECRARRNNRSVTTATTADTLYASGEIRPSLVIIEFSANRRQFAARVPCQGIGARSDRLDGRPRYVAEIRKIPRIVSNPRPQCVPRLPGLVSGPGVVNTWYLDGSRVQRPSSFG